jgi:hypothetical protein
LQNSFCNGFLNLHQFALTRQPARQVPPRMLRVLAQHLRRQIARRIEQVDIALDVGES